MQAFSVGPRNGVGKMKGSFDVVLVVQRIELMLEMIVFARFLILSVPLQLYRSGRINGSLGNKLL